MDIPQIEFSLKRLVNSLNRETFVFDFLLAYNLPKSSLTRLQKGNLNLSKNKNDLIWKKKLFFKVVIDKDLHLEITEMLSSSKYNERFIIVTDYSTILAIDTKTNDKLDINLKDLPKHYDFFLPWAGIEKAYHQDENPADVKAAVKMAKLFDEIRKDNPSNSPDFLHSLNIFLSRLLFCFFAEDTNIFEESQFTNSIDSHTLEDGSDLNNYFDRLFKVLNTSVDRRKSLPAFLNNFPYVNGGLFRAEIVSPKFTKSSRRAILDSGDQDWSAINPDIFGSMFQAAVSEEQRTNLGQHYTSVPNIMKVIKPLFLDDLYEVFKKNENNPQKMIELLNRLGKIKIFDPACGSGNFLIIAYKELRKLEIKIIQKLLVLQKQVGSFDPNREQLSFIPKSQMSLASSFQVDLFSRIQLNNFYGIEIDDFAHEITKLSLWLAEHQMNTEFLAVFGKTNPSLPLKEAGNIVCANACRIDWAKVCPKDKAHEIYILGNPPYSGFQERKYAQKLDMKIVFKDLGKVQRLDYIACWFKKASDFISDNEKSKYSFVSTNSISQGEQVSLIWPYIYSLNQEIIFAYQSFHWTNNAKHNAGVTVVIIGVSKKNIFSKFIYENFRRREVNNISPYLVKGANTIIYQRTSSISELPQAVLGSSGIDGGYLILSEIEKKEFIDSNNSTQKYIREFYGGGDLINGIKRYCLWIPDNMKNEAMSIKKIEERINKCKEWRLNAGRDAKKAADVPHRFFYRKHKDGLAIVFPMTSSGRRKYLPIGYSSNNAIISNGAFVIYNSETHHFGILSSLMHCLWMSITSARMRNDYRYSVNLTYNNLPFPQISEQRKQELTQTTFRILEEREKYPNKTLAALYDPDNMPEGLREAHRLNDLAVERCYRSKPFENDEERLEYLFKLYELMLEEENDKDTLFAKEKKTRKKIKK